MESAATLVHAIAASRIDYCNAVLAGTLKVTTDKLQRVLNSAVRVVSGTTKFDRGLSRLLHTKLHWLNVPERVAYKLSTRICSCMYGQALQFLIWIDFLQSGLQHRIATTLICQQTTPGCSTLPAKHHCPTGFLCGWSVGVEFFAGLPVSSCCWPR